MRATPCPRLFEAEAMRDGRLGEAERAGFGRHVGGCQDCTRELRALDVLGQALRSDGAEDFAGGGPDDLHVLRERTRLLAAFDGTLSASRRRWGRKLLLWPAAVAATALVVAVIVGSRREPGRPPQHSPVAVRAIVRAEGGAVWSRRSEDGNETITLDRGTLWIHVEHQTADGRLVLVLPDGELEDQGTTFTVSAADGRTQRVSVEEGRVLLRLHGQTPVAVGPTEGWSRPRAAALGRPGPAVPVEEPPPMGALSEPGVPAAAAGAKAGAIPAVRNVAAKPRRSSVAAGPARAVPAADFGAAQAAFQSGDNVAAAAAFAGFVTRYPRDPRAEDAAYLRVIALQKCGAEHDMRRAAADYLRLFPAGFRRVEVARLR